MRRNRGYTLIELLATIGLTSALLTLLAVWLTTALHNQRLAGEHFEQVNTQERLARQFRQDVHAARKVARLDPAEPEVRLRLEMGRQREVIYAQQPRVLERQELQGDAVVNREQFMLAPQSVTFEVPEINQRYVVLHMAARDGSREQHLTPVRIEANLGSDWRFAREASDED